VGVTVTVVTGIVTVGVGVGVAVCVGVGVGVGVAVGVGVGNPLTTGIIAVIIRQINSTVNMLKIPGNHFAVLFGERVIILTLMVSIHAKQEDILTRALHFLQYRDPGKTRKKSVRSLPAREAQGNLIM
jgi:hypothetical protein